MKLLPLPRIRSLVRPSGTTAHMTTGPTKPNAAHAATVYGILGSCAGTIPVRRTSIPATTATNVVIPVAPATVTKKPTTS